MTTFRKLLIFAISIIFFASCESWLDVNDNPNAATSIKGDYLFVEATAAFSGNRTSGDLYLPLGFGSQLWASGQLWGNAGDFYVFSPYTYSNFWANSYSMVGKNLDLAIKNFAEATPVNSNGIAQALIFQAINFWQLTMLWGDIPMDESFNPEVLYPHYQSQEDILEQIVALCDEAISNIDVTSPVKIDENDLFYGGDMDAWLALAKSLKFRTLFYLVDQKSSYSSQITTMLTEGGMINSSALDFAFPYFDIAGNRHPLYELGSQYYSSGVIDDMYMTPAVFDIMDPLSDPRIDKYFVPGEAAAADEFIPVVPSERATTATAYFNAEYLAQPDQPDYLFTYSEQKFLEAEAEVRFNNDLVAAKDAFDDAVAAAMERYGVTSAETTVFLSQFTFSSNALALQYIYEQHWIDNIDRPVAGFSVWRRSGSNGNEIPSLTVPTNAVKETLLRRWAYPSDEQNLNSNMPSPLPDLVDNLWFDL